MIDLIRSYSMPIGSTFLQDEPVDAYLDRHGAIRRSSSISKGSLQRGASISKGFLQRGLSDLKLDFLALTSPTESHSHDDESETEVPKEEDNEDQHVEPAFVSMSPQELEMLKQAQQDRRRRRSEMIMDIRERKRSLLISQYASVQYRLQLWYDTSELDPAVETSIEHTPLSPSSKAQTFIDADGNIRRKSIAAGSGSPHSYSSDSPIASPRLGSPLAAYMPQVRKSLVWEFVQSIIDD